jgi:hypothetical protein
MLKFNRSKLFFLSLLTIALLVVGCSSSSTVEKTPAKKTYGNFYQGINLDTIKPGKFDTGKMWTFEYPPTDYLKETYNFVPTEQWYEEVRMAALKFGTWCSASFVSEDGLVMTNHHCGRGNVTEVTKEGENFHETGFYAEKLEDERKVEGLFVDQLVMVKDVTNEVLEEMDKGKDDAEKSELRTKKIKELEKKFSDETGLICKITSLYQGGRYSLYGYKRYNDVRLVFAPEEQLGYYGGDYDNFTYPRYNLDFTFFRVYDENGKPLKTKNFYRWSKEGAKSGEPIFVIGNPGRTSRLLSVAQLEFMRDYSYPYTLRLVDGYVKVLEKQIARNPENVMELKDRYFSMTNAQKVYFYSLKGLNDPILMARKKAFEKELKKAAESKPELKQKYGEIWAKIENIKKEQATIFNEYQAFAMNPNFSSKYFNIADKAFSLLENNDKFEKEKADSIAEAIFKDFNETNEKEVLELQLDILAYLLGENNELVVALTNGKKGKEAVEYLLSKSFVQSKDKTSETLQKTFEDLKSANDPLVRFLNVARAKGELLIQKFQSLRKQEEVLTAELGRLIFEVYGTSIPPDATFTLRISDGTLKSYEYNGTLAPEKTTYYGLYDRYYSFNGKFPWSLPERWKNPPKEFELSVFVNFVSTNDIVGGNSGSPIINQNKEIVGLAFDGNVESIAGSFIYYPENNRCVGVASEGIIEALKNMYKANRLVKELINSKIVE